MNPNAKRGLLESGPSSKSSAVAAKPTVAHSPDAAQADALFPAPSARAVARPLVLITRGRTEFLARCPHCHNMHRHTHLGKVVGPCGAAYDLKPKRGRSRRAA